MPWCAISWVGNPDLGCLQVFTAAMWLHASIHWRIVPLWLLFSAIQCRSSSCKYHKEVFDGTRTDVYGLNIKVPGPNPIENVWIILVPDVYPRFRQIHSLDDLPETIVAACERINKETIQSLLPSIIIVAIKYLTIVVVRRSTQQIVCPQIVDLSCSFYLK